MGSELLKFIFIKIFKFFFYTPQDSDEDDPYPMTSVSYHEVIYRLLKYVQKHYVRIIASYVFMFIKTPLDLAQPYYYNAVIAQALHQKDNYDHDKQMHDIGMVIILTVISNFVNEIQNLYGNNYESVIDDDITMDLFKAVVHRDVSEFDKYGTQRMNNIMYETGQLANFILNDAPNFIRILIRFPGSFYVMWSLSSELSMVTLASIPILSVINHFRNKYSEKMWASRSNDNNEFADPQGHCYQVLTTIKNVRSFGCEREEIRRVRDLIEKKKAQTVTIGMTEKMINYAFDSVTSMFNFAVVLYGGILIRAGVITPETFLTFQSYDLTFNGCYQELRWSVESALALMLRAQKAFSFMDQETKVKRDGELRPPVKGDLKLENISFAYETRQETKVLEDLSLHIKAGESIALVGPSGGGKSTIVSLIERFYAPDSGTITLDGVPVEDIDDEYYHKQIALVAQEPVLYDRSIKDNILYGCDWATEDQMIEACKMANVHDFVSKLPDGYNTKCGESGAQMSGGQKQRIAIARALVREPSVLLLDEATSALDTESEYVVQEALERCCKNRTVIVIAHRLSTIRNCDKIAVIKDAKVSEFGSHSELVKIKDGTYAKLVQLQMKGFSIESIEAAFDDLTTKEEENSETSSNGDSGIVEVGACDVVDVSGVVTPTVTKKRSPGGIHNMMVQTPMLTQQ